MASKNQLKRIWLETGNKCVYCGGSAHKTSEHLILESWGGSQSDENLVPACYPCNQRRGLYSPVSNLVLDEFKDYVKKKEDSLGVESEVSGKFSKLATIQEVKEKIGWFKLYLKKYEESNSKISFYLLEQAKEDLKKIRISC